METYKMAVEYLMYMGTEECKQVMLLKKLIRDTEKERVEWNLVPDREKQELFSESPLAAAMSKECFVCNLRSRSLNERVLLTVLSYDIPFCVVYNDTDTVLEFRTASDEIRVLPRKLLNTIRKESSPGERSPADDFIFRFLSERWKESERKKVLNDLGGLNEKSE
jgi:hypothetical protein